MRNLHFRNYIHIRDHGTYWSYYSPAIFTKYAFNHILLSTCCNKILKKYDYSFLRPYESVLEKPYKKYLEFL